LVVNKNYFNGKITDLSNKVETIETEISRSSGMGHYHEGGSSTKKKEESELSKLTKDTTKLGNEMIRGVITQNLKESLFNVKLK
jgi:COP9 signalosome complex subunit 5